MKFTKSDLPGVIIISPDLFSDERGVNWEVHQQKKFADNGIPFSFVQDNQSTSYRTVLRGLHYQLNHTQGKLIRVVFGKIFDVAVDLRRSSPFFGKWFGITLSSRNKLQVWVPPGFAHGFYTLSNRADVTYKLTDLYSPKDERTLIWNDPKVNVSWPLIKGNPPRLSVKDANGIPLDKAEVFE